MTFQTILIVLFILIILILLKIFYLEQSQKRHYHDLQKEIRHLDSLLGQVQFQVNKLHKLLLPLEDAIAIIEELSKGATKSPTVDNSLHTESITTPVPTETLPPQGTLKLTLTDSQGLPLPHLKITFLNTDWLPEVTQADGTLVKLLPANQTYDLAIESTEGTILQTHQVQISPQHTTALALTVTLPSPLAETITEVNPSPEIPTTSLPSKPEGTLATLLISARDLLKPTWSWIMVGEEYRSKNLSIEYAIATTWLLRFGVVAILFATGYFLRYSIAKGYLVPTVKVTIVLLIGLSMLVSGLKLLRSKYYLIGQGLMGGGLAVLYFSIYAAAISYQLISLTAAFSYMILITITVAFLAVKIDSLLLAILAIIGGYASPLTLWAGHPTLIVLYSYSLLLGLGILIIAHDKQWRLLNYLAFVFNYLIFSNSLLYYQHSDFALVIVFLTLFFILHSSLVYIYNIAKGEKSSLLEITQLLINAVIYTVIAYYLIAEAYGKFATAWLSLSLALFYAIHAYLFIKHRPIDRNLIISLIALTGFYITWTMPLVFEKESLTFSWSLQALVFLWLGLKLRSNFIKNLAYLLYLTIFVRLLYFDIPRHFDWLPQVVNFSYYLATLSERIWTFGSAIAAILGALTLLHHPLAVFTTLEIDPRNDTPATLGTNLLESAFYWTGVLFLFLYLHLEFNTLFSYYEPLRLPMLTLLWCGMVIYFLHRYLVTKEALILRVMLLVLMITLLKLFTIDLLAWQITEQLIYDLPYNRLQIAIRFFDFALVMTVLLVAWRLLKSQLSLGILPFLLFFIDLLILLIYFSLELNNLLYWQLPEFQTAGISMLWALFAMAYVSGGIWRNVRSLRYLGLLLFIIVIGKIFLIDLAQTATLYRVIAFLLVGVTLLVGSFVYIYSRQKFVKT